MVRSTSASLSVALRATTSIAVCVVAALTTAYAQQAALSCQLLQAADIESAIGGKVSKKPAGERQSVPGMTIDTCTVEVARAGQGGVQVVGIRVITDLPMDGGQAILIRNAGTAREPQWKADGAGLEQRTIGSAVCIKYWRPGVSGHSICSIPRGKGYVEVDVRARSVPELASLETVAALTQKAAARR